MKNFKILSATFLILVGMLKADNEYIKTGYILQPLKTEDLKLGHLSPDLLSESQCDKMFTAFGMVINNVKRSSVNKRSWTEADPSYEPETVIIEKNHTAKWFESREHMEKLDYKRAFSEEEIVKYNLNRCGRTGFTDNQDLGTHTYLNWAGDLILTRKGIAEKDENPELRYYKLVQRKADGFWAIPGGMQNRIPVPGQPASEATYEVAHEAVLREGKEEMGAKNLKEIFEQAMAEDRATLIYQGYSNDGRNTDRAAIGTTVIGIEITGWKKDVDHDKNNYDKGEISNPGEWVAETDERVANLFAQHTEFISKYGEYLKAKDQK